MSLQEMLLKLKKDYISELPQKLEAIKKNYQQKNIQDLEFFE